MPPPRYEQVADALRAQIVSGALPPGSTVPSAKDLAYEHDVGRDTALKALRVLRGEGLLFMAPDKSIRVGPAVLRPTRGPLDPPEEVVDVPADAVVYARMPTPKERHKLELTDGVPVLVVRAGDWEEIRPADKAGLRIGGLSQA